MPETLADALTSPQVALLRYLQDRCAVPGDRIGLDPQRVKRDLGVPMTRLAEDSAALAARGFAGVRYTRTSVDDISPSSTCSALWVTAKGVDFLKRQRRPGNAAPDA